MQTYKFRQWQVNINTFQKYANGRQAIVLMDATNGELIAVATVNIPEESLAPTETIIKDYGENQGMLDFLMTNKIVSAPKRHVQTGWVIVPVVDLL